MRGSRWLNGSLPVLGLWTGGFVGAMFFAPVNGSSIIQFVAGQVYIATGRLLPVGLLAVAIAIALSGKSRVSRPLRTIALGAVGAGVWALGTQGVFAELTGESIEYQFAIVGALTGFACGWWFEPPPVGKGTFGYYVSVVAVSFLLSVLSLVLIATLPVFW